MNSICIAGNLTRDVELRYAPSGRAVASLAIAQTARHRTPEGAWEDGPTSYYSATCWGPVAENLAESVHRGDRVLLSGKLVEREFELTTGPRAGEKVRRHEIVVDEIAVSLRFATAKPVKARRGTEQPIDEEIPA